MRNSFADIFETINHIIKDGKISVNEYDVPVEFLLGGDYKVFVSHHSVEIYSVAGFYSFYSKQLLEYLYIYFQFLVLLLGMKGATSDHACIWCTIHKNNRLFLSSLVCTVYVYSVINISD